MSFERTLNLGPLSLIGVGLILGKIFLVEPVASWSWWTVTAPFWAPIALFLAIPVGIMFVSLTIHLALYLCSPSYRRARNAEADRGRGILRNRQ